ncbi:MAG: septum formation initiator family protein [Mangrovicoccus sp.]|nr:septum formation initiator family protein [Mangrovicoccus sp.]
MRSKPGLGITAYFIVSLLAITYFAFSAIRGDLGVIERLTVAAEIEELEEERDQMQAQIAALKNKTYRLSDKFLDLDLLDERARDVLGYLRADDLMLK